MLLVFRSMLPPSHYQNKPVHLSPWILFFTFGHANAFRSSYTHLTRCAECASCSTYTVYQNTHMNAHKHTEYILFCSPSSLSPKQLQTQNTLSLLLSLFPPSLIRHLIASPSVSLCPPPPLLAFFLSCLSAEQQREAAIDTHAPVSFIAL